MRARRPGYLQGLEERRLIDLAREHDLLKDLSREIAGTLIQGRERTPHQDLGHGVLELVDIALKGLSPGINDPTTAVNAMQRLAQILHALAWRQDGDRVVRDGDGRARLLIRRPWLVEVVETGFGPIRHFGAGDPGFTIAMTQLLGELAALSPEGARDVFAEQLRRTLGAARERIADETDLLQVEEAGERALERARTPLLERSPYGTGSAEGGSES